MSLYRKFVFPILCAEATRLFGEQRSDVFSKASGRVLEVGVGLGASLPLYSHSVSEVIGLEYSDEMLHHTERELNRLRSEPTQPAIGQVGMADGTNWDEDLASLAALGEELAALIESLEDDDLARTIELPAELDCPDNGSLILACLDHEAHHRGMVQLLLRLRHLP